VPRGNPDNLRASARKKSLETTERAQAALRDMLKRGEPITFRGLARNAKCSEDFLYSHPELRPRIEHMRDRQRTAPPLRRQSEEVSTSSVVRALTAQLAELRRRHRAEVSELREALAVAHGELLELRRHHHGRQGAKRPESG
jgi:Family of unknown function (DUF6262)